MNRHRGTMVSAGILAGIAGIMASASVGWAGVEEKKLSQEQIIQPTVVKGPKGLQAENVQKV